MLAAGISRDFQFMKVLIADDDDAVACFLKEAVEVRGYEAILASDGREAFEKFERERPDIVLSDLSMPEMSGLEFLAKVRETHPDSVFVIMTGHGSEEMARQALELRASNYLVKPVYFKPLVELLDKYHSLIEAHRVQTELRKRILYQDISLCIGNEMDQIPAVAQYLIGLTEGLLDDDQQFAVKVGLYELLMNAIEHGNLGIGYEEKRTALSNGPNGLRALVQERLSDPQYGVRRVRIHYYMEAGRCEWNIEDEGVGFDWANLPDPFANLESLNGRGIFLARLQFDKLEFMGNGNRVKATKLLP